MYNHIDDMKAKLMSGSGIGTLPCARYLLKSIEGMETILKRYYSKTQFPTVYGDGMILNPRTKLVIFNEDTWEDTASEEYSNACRHRFIQEYDNPPNNPSHQIGNPLYPDLSRMARDVLPVPASGCAVEREFSISGRMAIW